jgi:hypothetical protein
MSSTNPNPVHAREPIKKSDVRVPNKILLRTLSDDKPVQHVLVVDLNGRGSYKPAGYQGTPESYTVVDFNGEKPTVVSPPLGVEVVV